MSALVDYASSQESDDDDNPPRDTATGANAGSSSTKESGPSALPPLPSTFKQLYATNVRTSNSDDPELHGGRKRQVAHVSGNWPSHIYTEWSPTRYQLPILKDLITKVRQESGINVESLVFNDLGVAQPLHISLSRSLQVPTENRQELLSAIVRANSSSGPYAFHVMPLGLKWVSNYDGSRWFLALALKRPEKDELNQLLKICNTTLHSLGYPLLYTDDVDEETDYSDFFHFSLAWALSSEVDQHSMNETLEKVWASFDDRHHKLRVLVDALYVKLGNAVNHITLYQRMPTE